MILAAQVHYTNTGGDSIRKVIGLSGGAEDATAVPTHRRVRPGEGVSE